MSKKNEQIRDHLTNTADVVRTKNRFRFGVAVEISVDLDSPHKGVEFPEYIRVSVYDLKTGNEMKFRSHVDDVEIFNTGK
jgi:hypothetical protein